jgi:hypothetical protein
MNKPPLLPIRFVQTSHLRAVARFAFLIASGAIAASNMFNEPHLQQFAFRDPTCFITIDRSNQLGVSQHGILIRNLRVEVQGAKKLEVRVEIP